MPGPEQDTEAQSSVSVAVPLQIVVQVAHCTSQLTEETGTEIQPMFYLPVWAPVWDCVCPEGGTCCLILFCEPAWAQLL